MNELGFGQLIKMERWLVLNRIFLTSDWHFGHNKEFLYVPRGFATIEEHNEQLIKNHNSVVNEDDDVYVLGDLMLGDQELGIECIKQLKGRLHIIRGNHDTDMKWEKYKELPNVVELIGWATMLKYRKYHFYLSHFPTMTPNIEKESLKQTVINLYGHTHQQTNFYNNIPQIYHVGIDSHNNYPVLLDDIIEEIKTKYNGDKGEISKNDD